jgi:hypothetical protein
MTTPFNPAPNAGAGAGGRSQPPPRYSPQAGTQRARGSQNVWEPGQNASVLPVPRSGNWGPPNGAIRPTAQHAGSLSGGAVLPTPVLWPLTHPLATMQHLKLITVADAPWFLPVSMTTAYRVNAFYEDALAAVTNEGSGAAPIVLAQAKLEFTEFFAKRALLMDLSERGALAAMSKLRVWAPPVEFNKLLDDPFAVSAAVAGIRKNLATLVAKRPLASELAARQKRLQLAIGGVACDLDGSPTLNEARSLAIAGLQDVLSEALTDCNVRVAWETRKFTSDTVDCGTGPQQNGTVEVEQVVDSEAVQQDAALKSATTITPQPPRCTAKSMAPRGSKQGRRDADSERQQPSKSRARSESASPSQPENTDSAAQDPESVSNPIPFAHPKLAGTHNGPILQSVLRSAMQDCIEVMRHDERSTEVALWLAFTVSSLRFEAEYGVPTCRADFVEAERVRGVQNNKVGGDFEDLLFPFDDATQSKDEEKQLIALVLAAVERSATDRTVTRFGWPPMRQPNGAWTKVGPRLPTWSQVAPPHRYEPPTVDEVELWSAWLRHCQHNALNLAPAAYNSFVSECRANGHPVLRAVKSVRVLVGRATRGELDLVLFDAASSNVLAIGEIKISSVELIGARRQREKTMKLLATEAQRVATCLANGQDPRPSEDSALVFLCPGESVTEALARPAPTSLLTPASFNYVLEHPLYRWLMISNCKLPSCGSRAVGRIGWLFIREAGLAIGRAGAVLVCSDHDNLNPTTSRVNTLAVDAFVLRGARLRTFIHGVATDDAALQRLTSAMRGLWWSSAVKEGYEAPIALLKESAAIAFTNLLLVDTEVIEPQRRASMKPEVAL